MKSKLPLLTFWSAGVITCALIWLNGPVGVTAVDYSLTQPQIYVKNGHIYFIPAENQNLILKSSGRGKIMLNSLDLDNLTDSVKNSVKDLAAFKNIFGAPTSSGQISSRVANIEQTIQRLGQKETLDSRLTVVERQLSTNNRSDSGGGRVNARIRRLQNRIEVVENTLRGVGTSGQNPCSSNPCSNGGTCIPTIYGAFCYCTKGWEGERCDQDVNECANFAGTELGCQNGATCVNRPGTYQCQCQNGYFGIHCTKRSGDCSNGSSWELCGHGMCINQHTGSSPYTCICDAGWKQDGRSPACMTDIDECSQYHTTCSVNPPVSCINTPGSYVCGSCPPGYSGNGHQCMDINECLVNNGGCSVNPMVQCTNTVGSRSCGVCPPGYMGDGITCQYVGICHMNNGGCHPMARCVENPMIGQSFVQCICPAGYTGTGMGVYGCTPYQTPSGGGSDVRPTGDNPCTPNPCQSGGICHAYGGSYTCVCMQGFGGPTCSTRINACVSQPCQNGGTCQPTATGFTCACTSQYTGDMCERQVESCGGRLSATEGSLRFPQSQSTYDHNTRCEWLLHTTAGSVFNITFTNFHLEGGSSCSYDYLEIRDGTGSESPLLGRYCGDELPGGGNILSTHNILHLTFRSDHNVVGLGFAFTWNSTNPVCGGVLENRTHGSFGSPGYPGKYPHDRDCTWQIKGSIGKRLQLVFATFQLETHPNCSYDYVEVRDGLEDSAPVLEKLCNTTVPAPVISSGPYLTVRFHSDDSSSDQGFLISYTEVPGVPGCGGLLTAASGVFSSPQHPQPYAHGLECDWVIRLSSTDDKISVSFLSFELEGSYRGCVFDYIEIHDGPSLDSPLVGRFCGRNLPPSFKSRSNQLFIRFKSDESIALGGFSAKYEAVCGGMSSSLSGLLRSPYYPNNYPSLRDCVYVISLPAGNGINLQFLDFDIEPGTDTNCHFDYLEIRDGDNENSTLIGHYCGPPQSAPELITSSFNYLWLRFKTDGSVQNRGFLANYTAFETGCGGILTGSEGTITSPGHPDVYSHGLRCMWVIRGKPGEVVRLTWDSFNLESSANCTWDVVEVYDNSTSFVNGSLIGRYCGQDHPPQMTSTDTILTVIFKSDHSTAFDGFTASFKLLNVTTACGGNYFTEYGVLESPRYPHPYPNSRSCTWVITAPRGRQIELNVTDFDMEEGTGSDCRYDYLEIRNGPFATSPLIGKFCGNRPPPSRVPSFSNSLYLKFKSDSYHSRRGFNIEWDATSTGCGGVLATPSGSITSPNYPSPYGGGIECVWKIIVSQGSAVQISFVDIDMQHSTSANCWGDHVEVLDGVERNSRSLGKFCSDDHAVSLQSSDNSVTIKMVISVFGGNGRGFQLNYRTMCNRVLKGFQGVIESVNYPNPYPHNRNCTWVIQAGKGNGVNMSFSHFDVEASDSGNCTYDFVQISEWKREDSANKTILGTYCGVDRPRLVSSQNDTVAITFVSDHNHASNGFRLEWKQHGCGGHIIGSYNSISSPGYPKRYANNLECIWKVTTELGTKVQLTVVELDIEHGDDCIFDGLMIHGGPDETSPLLSKLCQKTNTAIIVTSHGNNMFLKLYSDGFFPSKGFYGYVAQVPGGCGGTYRGASGNIYTPNYPANYDHNDDCSWLISVDLNHVVELTFEDFDVKRHINCTFDHVAIYDGSSEYDPLLLTHCGNQLPDPVTVKSSGAHMLVRLKTDGSAAGKGFKAHYALGCGSRLTVHYGGAITTPNYPGMVDKNTNCSWVLVSPSPDDRISLTFTYMDLTMHLRDELCQHNYVQVLDGEDSEAPSLYKACGGGRMPPTLTSRGNALVLNFVGIGYGEHGFRAVYDVSSSACGGVLTAANGSLTTPNFPNGYPSNIECIWEIAASAGNQVQISFRRFEIETSEFCNTDFVEIHQDSASGPLLGHYCGMEIPSNITAAEKLWILFRSDGEGQAAGFWADYNLVHGVELSGSFGAVASPMYPNTYSGTGLFTWRIVVNDTYAIQISFVNYDIEALETINCEWYNQIKIYDGYDENSPVLLSTCSSEKPDPIISTGNTVYIEYNRVRWVSSFYLEWQQVQASSGRGTFQPNITGCGGNFSLMHGNNTSLTNPGFPNHYLSSLNCEWTFDAPPSSRIRLNVETLSLRGTSRCLKDKVELYDGVRGLPNYELNKTICYEDPRNRSSYLSSGRFLKVVFKSSDRAFYGARFNFTLRTECGGFVRDHRGTISTPNYPNNYVESNCVWKVIVRPGRTIRLTFNSNFDIYSASGQCVTDQLILRNGENEESPFLGSGRYCGTTAPANLETSGNHLFVHFTSWTHGGKGFALTFEEVSLGCGGTIQLTDNAPTTIIQSPNFPQIPPPHTECEWVFTAPQGEAVQVTFQVSFEFANSEECHNAGLEVHDGGTPLSHSLGVFCKDMPGTLKSTGNALYIRYYTNVAEPRSGFKAEVAIATCGGVQTKEWGSISSPGFPATYEANVDCVWTIKVRRGDYVYLTFENYNMGSVDANCTKDKIIITDPGLADAINNADIVTSDMITSRNWTLCGLPEGIIPEPIRAGSNEVRIHFTSDDIRERNTTGMGFKMHYEARQKNCGGSLRTPTGFIQSPQPFPSYYMYCEWKIYAPEGRRIRIEFIELNLHERSSMPNEEIWGINKWRCRKDQLMIVQGHFYLPLYNESLCGSSIPPPVETTSNEATIYLRTTGDSPNGRFKLHYTTDLPILCGGTLDSLEGNITSPSPNITTNTPNTTTYMLCEWKTGDGNGTTIITIHSLRIPSSGVKHPWCMRGNLGIFPVDTSFSYNYVEFCGTYTNEKFYLLGGSLQVEYVTDDPNATFSLSYITVPCGGRVRGPEDNITSLHYPQAYPINTDCIWDVQFSWGSQIKIKFLDLDTDDHQGSDGCDRDYVLIRNGRHQTSPVLGKYCGTYFPSEITSMSSDIWVEFHSDSSADGNRRGFQLQLEESSNSCGGVLHSKYGQIVSPKQQSDSMRYPHNTECEWVIETSPGYTVNLVFFNRFDLENSTNCTNDYVGVFQKSGLHWILLDKFCGRQLPQPINSTSTSVKVVFKSNEKINGDGFSVHWYSPCGGVFQDSAGVIRSAHHDPLRSRDAHPGRFASWTGYENIYAVQKCDYVVKTNEHDYIMVRFLDPFEIWVSDTFAIRQIDQNTQCPEVNVTIWEGNSTHRTRPFSRRRPFCGTEAPPPFIGRGSVVISYNYVGYYKQYGFRAQYNTFECGGEIATPRTIKSPGHPFKSTSNMNCTWIVRAPLNKVARFKFGFLETEFHQSCHYDSVRLYDGPLINNKKLIGAYCGNMTTELPKISSESSSMTVVFATDYTLEHRGFEAEIDFTVGQSQGCGGTKNLTAGPITLTSVDTDGNGNYENDLDCQWLVIAPEFKSIELTFSAFNLEGSQGLGKNYGEGTCPFDFVEIRDGPGPHGQLLAKLCGNVLPSPIISSLNFVWLRFVTDGFSNLSGFNVTAAARDSPCGQSVFTANNSLQYLTSPGYPANYDNNVRCRWTINGARWNDEVDIAFIELDIEAAPDCSKDWLEIRDVSSSYTTREGPTGPALFTGNVARNWRFRNSNLNMSTILQDFKYCGSETPADFFTIGRAAEIVFHTDGDLTRKGFKIAYKAAGCNRTYENTQGRIYSPEWPAQVPIFSNCLSSIRAPNGSYVALYFNSFSLTGPSAGSTCTDSAFEVRDTTPSGQVLAQYCGASIPNPVFSTSNVLYIKFFSRWRRSKGFDITYTTTDRGRGCGGDIFHTSGSFTSPMYPGNYSMNMDCIWRIRVPGGLRVQLEFTNFMFNGNCQTDFVEISSLESHDITNAPVLYSRYCPGDVPSVYTGNTDMAVVRYKTSVNNTGSGWRATFKGVYPTNVPV